MKRYSRHSILILIGLFLFPILYQSVHIVLHAHPEPASHCSEHCCSPESLLQNSQATAIQTEEENCPVCEYQFTVNTLQDLPVFRTFIPVLLHVFAASEVRPTACSPILHKPGRAPPSLL